MKRESVSERRAVAISALVFAFGTLLSRILGLYRDILIARFFPDDVRDAFINAFRLPNLFRRVFGEGSLSVSFIPVFIGILNPKARQEGGETEARARALVGGMCALLLSVTSTVSLLAILFMEDLMRLLVGGSVYMSVPGKFELTVRLGRVMFVFLVLISLYGFFMAILNSLRKFTLTALAPCLFNIAMITGAMLSRRTAEPVLILGISVVVGGLLQMAILIPALVKTGFFPWLRFHWSNPDIQRVLGAVVPSAFGLSILQITAVVNMRFAANLESGSHSYLYLADRILEFPLSLFVVSIGSALLPTLARYWSAGDKDAMADTINHYLRLIVFIAWPASVGMFILAQPITEVLFFGKEFKYDDVIATAAVIRVYAFTVIISAGVRILAQGFYAIHNTWFPALASGIALFAHVIFAYVLTRQFGLVGLAAASVCSAFVNLMMLAAAYNSWVGSLRWKLLFKSFAKFALGGGFMIGALQLYPLIHQLLSGRFWGARLFALGVTIGIASIVYMACAHLLKVEEFRETVATLRAALSARLNARRAKHQA